MPSRLKNESMKRKKSFFCLFQSFPKTLYLQTLIWIYIINNIQICRRKNMWKKEIVLEMFHILILQYCIRRDQWFPENNKWVLYYFMVDGQILGPSWIWTSVDILPTNLQSVPINRSGIDPGTGRINFSLYC